jgi:hypothetical protein
MAGRIDHLRSAAMPVDASTPGLPVARRLAGALEPFVGSVYFAPECHANYVGLGFAPSRADANGVALPDGPAYFTSRGSVMGRVAGEVVAAAFGVFNPAAVIPSVSFGWTITDASAIAAARSDGAVAQLRRILGPEPVGCDTVIGALRDMVAVLQPHGRPLFAGVISQPEPIEPVGIAWWLGDALREYRGDAHTAAWIAAGLDAVEIGLLTELFIGLPLDSYIRTRAWSPEQIQAGIRRLTERDLVTADRTFTDAGRAFRTAIEVATDRQLDAAVQVLGERADEVVTILGGWSSTVRANKGYLGAGAGDLARQARPEP